MPFPNEHACRVREPSAFTPGSFRRITRKANGKTLGIIIGRLKGKTTTTTQAFRYPKKEWSASSARSHCSKHDGKSFEPASSTGRIDMPEIWVPDGHGGFVSQEICSQEFEEIPDEEVLEQEQLGSHVSIVDFSFAAAIRKAGLTPEEFQAALKKGQLRGYAAVWGKVDDRPDVVEQGAFTKTLKEHDINEFKFLWQHFPWEPIGITKALEEDNVGLLGLWEFSKSSRGVDAHADTVIGAVDAFSIGFDVKAFRVQPQEDSDGNELPPLRIITEMDLFEISLVSFPAAKRARVLEVNSGEQTCGACIEVNGVCFPCSRSPDHFPITAHRGAPGSRYQIAWSGDDSEDDEHHVKSTWNRQRELALASEILAFEQELLV